jgi:UDP-glucose 4-epimerase
MKNKILLTGSTGFVGSAVLRKIKNVVLLGRSSPDGFNGLFIKRDLSAKINYLDCFDGVKAIVHCAARVHVMNEKSENPLQAFRDINVDATLRLAQQASDAGVERFIYISSIKVNGESTQGRSAFTPLDKPQPEDAYGISKYEAEQALTKLSKETGMELVIIRPTLIYGAGVKGNFRNLLKLSKIILPLPFGSINNHRSMVYLENLVDLIITCLDHPNAPGEVFLVSDNEDVSLSKLISLIRKSMGKSALLIPVPVCLFRTLGKLTGKKAVIDRLVGNLQVDGSAAKQYLDWEPPYTIEQGIKATVENFIGYKNLDNK